jgi:hypothetical protein
MAAEKPGTSQPIASPEDDAPAGWSTRRKVIAVIIAVLALAAIIAAAVLTGAPGSPSGSETSSSATPDPTDAASATPGESGTAAPGEPSATAAPGEPPATAAPGEQPAAAPAVPMDESATINAGVTAKISNLEAVEGVAQAPGEVAAPSVRVTVDITNDTDAEVDLSTTVVTAYFGDDQTPALELNEPGASLMPATVAAGGTATGIYVFSIPPDQRQNVRIVVDYSVDVAPLVFEGQVPG